MICKTCAQEADDDKPERGECGVCGREFAVTVNGLLPRHKGQVVVAPLTNQPNIAFRSRSWCSGGGLPAMWGHALCVGCDCAHKRKGDCIVTNTS